MGNKRDGEEHALDLQIAKLMLSINNNNKKKKRVLKLILRNIYTLLLINYGSFLKINNNIYALIYEKCILYTNGGNVISSCKSVTFYKRNGGN